MRITDVYWTGLKRGYIKVADRHESELKTLPSLNECRGNLRRAVKGFMENGCTHYTVEDCQMDHSTRYFYTIYRGYKDIAE